MPPARPGAGRQSWTCTPCSPYTSSLLHLSSRLLEMLRLPARRAAKETKGGKGCKRPGSVRCCPLCSIHWEDPTTAPDRTPDAAAQEDEKP